MAEGRYRFGPFELDSHSGLLQREGVPVAVGQRGLALLGALLEAEGQPVTKAALFERAWPGTIVEEVNLSVQIAALRKALGAMPDGHEWIATVPRVGYRLPRPIAGPTESGPPAIAVLPFANLSSDPAQTYFADGVVEDIITALSRFKSFAVIARNSSFAYRDRAIDVREVARTLGVRYVLEGSVQRRDTQIRVTAQLIDALTGVHLWAERFDGDFANIFDFQDRITEAVAGVIEPQIREAEIERARAKRPDNLDAYDLFLQALPHFYGISPDGYATAIELLERAIALDPDFGAALAYAAHAYEKRETTGMPSLYENDHQRCIDLARRALRTGAGDALVLATCGYVLMALALEKTAGLAAVRRAVELNPNNARVLLMFGIVNALAGDPEAAVTAYLRAYQLSPGAPDVYEMLSGIGFVRCFQERFEEAVDWHQRALATFTEWEPTYWSLAASYAHLGRRDEARATVARLLVLAPHSNLTEHRRLSQRSDERYELLIDGLRMAGLPEV